MGIPEHFQFSDNPTVNEFASAMTEKLFGAKWRSRTDLKFLTPKAGWRIVENQTSGWMLEASKSRKSGNYTVSCRKLGEFENPEPNIPAVSEFYSSGKVLCYSHHSGGGMVNPPDGSPAYISFAYDGAMAGCSYVGDRGNMNGKTVTIKEIAVRMDAAKREALKGLCAGGQEIVALESRLGHKQHPQSNMAKFAGTKERA